MVSKGLFSVKKKPPILRNSQKKLCMVLVGRIKFQIFGVKWLPCMFLKREFSILQVFSSTSIYHFQVAEMIKSSQEQ